MGMSTHVTGFLAPDEEFKKMKKVYDTCKDAGIDPPEEVWKFFNYDTPNDAGMEIDISKYVDEARPHDMADGYQIDLARLAREMPQVKTVLFYNSY